MSFSSKIFLNSYGDSSSLRKESRRHSKHGVTPREDDLPIRHTAPIQRKHEAPGELDNILQLSVRLRGSVELQPRSHSFMERGRCISAGLRHWLSDGYIMYVRLGGYLCMYPQVVAK